MHGAGDVQRHVREEQQQAGELVGDVLHGVEVAGVDEHHVVAALLRGIGHVELLVAGGEALHADAEDLLLHGVDDVRRVEGVDLVERVAQTLAHTKAVGRVVLQAVGDPEVVEHHVVKLLADALGDLAAGDAMANPEVAHVLVRRGDGQALLDHGMAEQRGVEVDAEAVLLSPSHPRLEVLVLDLVAVDPGVLVGEDGIAGMQVDALLAGDEAARLLEVGRQLLEGAGAARVVARGHDAAGGRIVLLVEAHDVVALPAVDGDRLAGQLRQDRLGVDALGGVCLACQFVSCAHMRSYLG